jgi:LmbE family N-acetylglucosaminyl deacetylase
MSTRRIAYMLHSWQAVAAVLLVTALMLLAGVAVITPACAQGTTLSIVAHQDDDLLFLSPDLLHDIQSGRRVVTIFVTAGDAGQGSDYWLARERGSQAAYAQISGQPDSWTEGDAGVEGHPIRVRTLNGNRNISLVFMRLPDGNDNGSGFASNGYQSLQKLWWEVIPTISAIDGSSSYSEQDITSVITSLMDIFTPDRIYTLDYSHQYGINDHSDHLTVARIALEAHQAYTLPHVFQGYQGYINLDSPANVVGSDLAAKQNAFLTYAQYDLAVLQPLTTFYTTLLQRQYPLTDTGGEPVHNVAPEAYVTASSQNTRTGQTAVKAVDGVADGYPGDYTHEWATQAQRTGAWLNLRWSTSRRINSIVLYDRPNPDDQVTAGMLTFSDNSSVPVGPLNNDGSAVTINFPARTVTSVRFTVTGVSTLTQNVGLSEMQVFGQDPTVLFLAITAPADVVAEGVRPSGTPVDLGLPTVSSSDQTPSVGNNAPDLFPLGVTVVTWTATDSLGTTVTATQRVTIVDTTPPALSVPGPLTVTQTSPAGTMVNLETATATDNCDVAPVVTNDAPSVFPVGVTVVTWTATDASHNTSTATQTVTVTPMLTIIAPAEVTAEGVSPSGTPVSLGSPTVSDIIDPAPAVSNNAPALFPLGVTVVTWTATDSLGYTATATQRVTIMDTTPPALSVPGPLTVVQTIPAGATVTLGTATATDKCDPAPVVTNDAPSVFPVGITVVTWTATDASHNKSTATQTVTVTSKLTIAAPADVTAEGVSPNGTPVALGSPTVSSLSDPAPIVSNNAPALFPLGVTTVTWTVTNSLGQTATATQKVTIADTTPPVISVPGPLTVPQTSPAGATVNLGTATATDRCDPAPAVTNNAPSIFPLGVTVVIWTATDASHNTSTATQTVTVTPTSTNIGPQATVTASTQATKTGQLAIKAVDGVADGYPGDYTREWVTLAQKTGAWLNLQWSTSRVVSSIVLYDRPNLDDQVTAGRLTFSDGSSVPVGALNNNGTAVTVNFPARTVRSVRFTVTSVSASTQNVGLAEIQVYGQ